MGLKNRKAKFAKAKEDRKRAKELKKAHTSTPREVKYVLYTKNDDLSLEVNTAIRDILYSIPERIKII